MVICEYGCGKQAKKQLKNGKWCCSNFHSSCPSVRKRMSESGKKKIFSEEHRKNIGKLRKGKKRPKHSERMRGESNPFYGKLHSKYSKEKMSEKRKGVKRSNESVIKQVLSIMGENNPNWKGGITCDPYCDVWYDKDYKKSIQKRDGYRCLNPVCSKNDDVISVHHINYNKQDCHPLNLITICRSCNTKANFNRRWHKSWYEAIIYRRYT